MKAATPMSTKKIGATVLRGNLLAKVLAPLAMEGWRWRVAALPVAAALTGWRGGRAAGSVAVAGAPTASVCQGKSCG